MALNKFRIASLLSFVNAKVFDDTYTKYIFFSSKYALAT